MPSGSHGGSPGSHSSGGSSFGGSSSFGGGGSSFGRRRGGRSTFMFFGRRYYLSSRGNTLVSIFSVILTFALILFIGGIAITFTEKAQVKKIKEDYNYYQGIISLGHITNAQVDDMFFNESADKYYITYIVDIPNSSIDLEGYSYSVYTREEALALLNAGTIQVALNKPVNQINSKTDSVPVDYLGMPLERDGEYVNALKGVRNAKWCAGISGTIIAVLIVGIVIVCIKSAKTQSQTTEVFNQPTTSREAVNTDEISKTRCDYCGQIIKATARKCPHCQNKLH